MHVVHFAVIFVRSEAHNIACILVVQISADGMVHKSFFINSLQLLLPLACPSMCVLSQQKSYSHIRLYFELYDMNVF